MEAFKDRLRGYECIVDGIRAASGAPGIAVGLYQKSDSYTYFSGSRAADSHAPLDQDTIFHVASLAKPMTAAALGMLVEDGLMEWNTPVHEILPELSRESPLYQAKINVLDIMSHGVGIAASEALYMQGNNRTLSTKDESIAMFDAIPILAPPRTEFFYNNQAFNILGLVIERLSGKSYGDFLQERILGPLHMNRSFSEHVEDENMAVPFSILLDKTPYELPHSDIGGNTTLFAGQSIRSSLGDLLKFYGAYLESLPTADGNRPRYDTPLKQLSTVIRPRMGLPTTQDMLLEQTHACAINRTQLPGPMGFGWNRRFVEKLPLLGRNAPSTLLLWLNGYMPGVTTKVCLLPEHETVIVVLQNSVGLTDAADWVSSLLIDVVLSGEPGYDYLALAEEGASNWAKRMDDIDADLENEQVPGTKPRALDEYTGLYWNGIKNWFIEVGLDEGNGLWLRMQGREDEQYTLRHYHHDTFVWNMDHDNTVRKGLFFRPVGYWKLEFGAGHSPCTKESEPIKRLIWQHDPLVKGGESFEREARK